MDCWITQPKHVSSDGVSPPIPDVKAAPVMTSFAVFAASKLTSQNDDVSVIWHRNNGCLTAIVHGLSNNSNLLRSCDYYALFTLFESSLTEQAAMGGGITNQQKKLTLMITHFAEVNRVAISSAERFCSVRDQSVPVAFDAASFLAQMDFSGYILSRITVPAKLLNRSLKNI
ncbi:hypothetical protein BV898_19197 [Hypsibius exemplaris]|uniref:Uncharacterized protein n=1 Tax=Hypsibius exemplaris TaxID=2072580 RepID=A0A9X6NL74_HYPEX|nr:hypothetical protein BV898_19197 [Hypsibius exemplaris]